MVLRGFTGVFAAAALPPGVTLGAGWDGIGTALIDRDGEPVLVVPLARLVPDAAPRSACRRTPRRADAGRRSIRC